MPSTTIPQPATALHLDPIWQALQKQVDRFASPKPDATPHHAGERFDLRTAFAQDSGRQERFSRTLRDDQGELLYVDCSKSHIDDTVWQLLLELAESRQASALRDAMFAGAAINTSEQRQVMHWLLRKPDTADLPPHLLPAWQEMDATRRRFLDFAEAIRANPDITDIVNIGIGGSDLGPCMAVQALQAHAHTGKRFHFISNIDGHVLQQTLQQLNARNTLFIVSSKSFSTLETMHNARAALEWFRQQTAHTSADVAAHFVGITTNTAAAASLGIHTTFGFWDWVGGRYSLWSAIGMPLAIAIGAQGFEQLLAGAHAVDRHFVQAAPDKNLPLLLGLLQVWESSLLRYTSRCMAPYLSSLQRLPAYLQQLEMESNGKSMTRNGQAVHWHTTPALWGEPGTNSQHAFFQQIRQGTDITPVEFIVVRQAQHPWHQHHVLLLANALAQAQALMQGYDHANPHQRIAGNRPSTFFVLPELTPRTLGALLAVYEHRTFVSGAVWDINSFDQWGVEQGKVMALDIASRWQNADTTGLDASTAHLLRKLCQ